MKADLPGVEELRLRYITSNEEELEYTRANF